MKSVRIVALVVAGALLAACSGGPAQRPAGEQTVGGGGAGVAVEQAPASPETQAVKPADPVVKAPERVAAPVGEVVLKPVPAGQKASAMGLYVVTADGGSLWHMAEGTHGFAWSPDGSKIIVPRSRERLVVELPGGKLVRALPAGAGLVAWSPDGRQIAYSYSGKESAPGVYVENADGTGRRLVTSVWPDRRLSWSPAGQWLAMAVEKGALAVVDTVSGEAATVEATDGTYTYHWSPDGKKLGFVLHGKIRVLEPATGKEQAPVPFPLGDIGPYWSPNGQFLLASGGLGSWDAKPRDFRVLPAGGGAGPVLEGEGRVFGWSNDGRWIAYDTMHCAPGVPWGIYAQSLDGRTKKTITEKWSEGPYWSPAAPVLAYSGDKQLSLFDVESGTTRSVTLGEMPHLHANPWSPDGKYLAFALSGGHGGGCE